MARLAILAFSGALALYVGLSAAAFISASFADVSAKLETISASRN